MNRMKCVSSILLSGVLSLALVGCNTDNQEQSISSPINEPIEAVSVVDVDNDEQVSNSIKKINILGTKYAELKSYETVSWEFEIDSVNVDVDNIKIKTDRKDKATDDNYLFFDRIEKLNNGNYKLYIVGGITTGECNAWLEIDGVKSDSIKVKVDASNKDEGDELRSVNYETLCFQVPKKLVESAYDNVCVCENNINKLIINKYNIDYIDSEFNKQFALDVFTSMSETFTFDKDSIIGVNKEQYSYFCVNIDLDNKNDAIAYLLLDSVNHNLYFCLYGSHKGQLTDADRKCVERIINSIKVEDILKIPSDIHEGDKTDISKNKSTIQEVKLDNVVFKISSDYIIDKEDSDEGKVRYEKLNDKVDRSLTLARVKTEKRWKAGIDSVIADDKELIDDSTYFSDVHIEEMYTDKLNSSMLTFIYNGVENNLINKYFVFCDEEGIVYNLMFSCRATRDSEQLNNEFYNIIKTMKIGSIDVAQEITEWQSKKEIKTEDSEVEESNVEDIKYSEPIVFSGFGDTVITDIKLPNKMYKVELRHNGSHNFITQVYAKSGKRLSSLSNEIGTYSGEIILTDDIDGGTLEVKADGEWCITFMDVEYGGTSKVSGKGDRVTKYFSLGTGVNVVNMRHNGDHNFIVCIYDNTGRMYSVLANEIGNYTGSVVFNKAEYGKKYCLEIIADGDWDIDFSKDDEVTYYN